MGGCKSKVTSSEPKVVCKFTTQGDSTASSTSENERDGCTIYQGQEVGLLSLDEYVLGKILSYLDYYSLFAIQATCSTLRRLASDPLNWNKTIYVHKVHNLCRSIVSDCLVSERTRRYREEKARRRSWDVQFVLNRAGKYRTIVQALNLSTARTICTLFGPVVAKLYCLIDDFSYENYFNVYETMREVSMIFPEEKSELWDSYIPGNKNFSSLQQERGPLMIIYRTFRTEDVGYVQKKRVLIVADKHKSCNFLCVSTYKTKYETLTGKEIEFQVNHNYDLPRLEKCAELWNNLLGETMPKLNWEFVKWFIESIVPVFCDGNTQCKLRRFGGSKIQRYMFKDSHKNRFLEHPGLGPWITAKHERYKQEFFDELYRVENNHLEKKSSSWAKTFRYKLMTLSEMVMHLTPLELNALVSVIGGEGISKMLSS